VNGWKREKNGGRIKMAKQRQYEMEILLGARKANTFSSVLGSIKSDLGTLTSTATTVASGIAAAFAGVQIGSIISDATETYKEYQSEMAYTASVAKANTAEYEMMDEAAREAGRDTVKTATEASEALSYMALAGWDTTQSVQALPDVLKLSAATSEDLATTSDLVTDSMSAMNVEVGNLGQYLDVVIQANNSANTSASEMMESFIKSGGALRSLNIDLNESATAVGVLANNGTKGEQAGTALNAMLTRMASNSTALKQMEKLGVSVYDASGNFVGFEQALKNINEGLDTLGTEAEKNSALSNIAGKQYYSKLIYLLDSVK
jgi:TP901 family phage tail tape measure protein